MSKAVTIYEVNFERLCTHVPGLIAGSPEFNVFVQALATAPENLVSKQYSDLMDFFSANLLSENNRHKELAELGISKIERFQPTYLAVVFMELLQDLLPDETAYRGYDFYKVSKERLLSFTEVLMLYKEIFQQQENPEAELADFYNVSPMVREQYTTAGKQLLEQEIARRKALDDDYSGKWFAHYFHFFETVDPHGLKNSLLKNKGDAYLIEDSY